MAGFVDTEVTAARPGRLVYTSDFAKYSAGPQVNIGEDVGVGGLAELTHALAVGSDRVEEALRLIGRNRVATLLGDGREAVDDATVCAPIRP